MNLNQFKVAIGLEIHAQMNTKTKMFSPDSTDFHQPENTQLHPVSLGMPGALPLPNQKVIKSALLVGQAFRCDIQEVSYFARKNYFYPDLPKGYQISQFDFPILKKGFVEFYHNHQAQKIHLERVHIEEDAGQLIHKKGGSLVNFNRAGTALLEIVTYPEMTNPKQAADFSRMVRTILLELKVCDGNMQEGSMRFDCNISINFSNKKELGTKVEIKNLNSFKFMEKALNFEIKRQAQLLEKGEKITQETRLYDPKKNETFSMRSKEEASDYRYFPDPDLLPIKVDVSQTKSFIQRPFDKISDLHKKYHIPLDSASLIVEEPDFYKYFEQALKKTKHANTLCKWMINEVLFFLKETDSPIKKIPLSPQNLAELVNQVENKTLSSKMAKILFSKMWETGESADHLIKKLNLKKVDDEETLSKLVDQIIKEFPDQCREYKNGKENVHKFLIGQIMKLSQGQADPTKASFVLKKKLDLN